MNTYSVITSRQILEADLQPDVKYIQVISPHVTGVMVIDLRESQAFLALFCSVNLRCGTRPGEFAAALS